MKNFAVIVRSVAGAAAVCLLAGCMKFEYTGREFAHDPGGMVPKYFESRSKMPAGKYSIIGRGVLIADNDTEKEDIISRLQDEAAKRGADAVCVVSVKHEKVGLFESDGEYAGPDNVNKNPFNLTPDGSPIRTNLAGKVAVLPGEHTSAVRLAIKVLFFKDRIQLEKIVSERKEQLDRMIDSPASLPGVPAKRSASK